MSVITWHPIVLLRTLGAAAIFALVSPVLLASQDERYVRIASGDAYIALRQLVEQTGIQVLFSDDEIRGHITQQVDGVLPADEALARLLSESGLSYRRVNESTVSIQAVQLAVAASHEENGVTVGAAAAAETKATTTPAPSSTADQKGVPEILIRGARTLNMDIVRTHDDIQPYVVFGQEEIKESGALNIGEFLKYKLSMANVGVASQSLSAAGDSTSISLRGLSANETLVLIDGHRVAGFQLYGTPQQPSLSGIPLAAIERIEVLPATASGIYGGSATGGVINVVLRRDYEGLESRLTYEGTFDGGGTSRRVDVTTGTNLFGGRTNLLFAGSFSNAGSLLTDDRDFAKRGRATILENNPSAFFGGPFVVPLGRTTNIVGLDPATFEATDLSLKSGVPLNSPFTYVPVGYAGAGTDGGAAFLQNAGSYNLDLARTAQGGGGARQSLLNAPQVTSGTLTINQEITQSVRGFLELSGSSNSGKFNANNAYTSFYIPADAPNNPFAQDIQVTTPGIGADGVARVKNSRTRAVAGITAALSENWSAEFDYTWDRTRFFSSAGPGQLDDAVVAADVSSGALDVLRDTNAYPVDLAGYTVPSTIIAPVHTTLTDMSFRLSGIVPQWSAPGGPIALSSLIEFRKELIGDTTLIDSFGRTYIPSRSQKVGSLYVEAQLPVVSAQNRKSGIELFEIQLAGRADRYDTVGTSAIGPFDPQEPVRNRNKRSSVDPTIGFRYKPIPDVLLRGSYSTGFVAPAVDQLVPTAPFELSPFLGLVDPLRDGEPLGAVVPVMAIAGGNPNLRPEKSRSRAAGIVLTPRVLPGARVSLDWTKIKKTDAISGLGLGQSALEILLAVPGKVLRGPDESGVPGPITFVDASLLNVSRTSVEAWDVALDYQLASARFGEFSLSLKGTRQTINETQAAETSTPIDFLGTTNSLVWKANSQIGWRYRNWSLDWATTFFDSYWVNFDHSIDASQGAATIPSQIYHDAFATYAFGAPSLKNGGIGSWLSGGEVRLGVKNVFNRRPPIDVVEAIGSYYSRFGDPRLASYFLSVSVRF